jgi:hypothetical protein
VDFADPKGLNAVFMVGGNRKDPTYFTRIAEAWAEEYRKGHAGQSASVVQVRTVEDINNALRLKNLDRVDYIGHSSNKQFYLSDTTFLFKWDVASLVKDNVKPGASIMLTGCDTAKGPRSIAEAFANRFGRNVIGTKDGISFGVPFLNKSTHTTDRLVRTKGTICDLPYIVVKPTN